MATGIIDQLKDKLILKRFVFGYGGSIAAGTAKRLLASDAGYSIPAGYYPVGVTTFTTGHSSLVLDYLYLQNTDSENYFIAVRNVHSSSSAASSVEATLDVLFAPEWMVELISADESAKPKSDIQAEPVFKIANFTCEYSSLSANGGAKAFTRSEMGLFVPEGYEIFSLRNFGPGTYRVSISDCDPFSPSRMLTIRNMHTSAVSGTAAMGVVFINRKYMQPDTRKGLIIWLNIPTEYNIKNGDMFYLKDNDTNKSTGLINGGRIWPSVNIQANHELQFFLRHYIAGTPFDIYPNKVEVIKGDEYITFDSSYCWKFTIPEDWTDRQIILKFTFA